MGVQHFDSETRLPGCVLPARSTLIREGAAAVLISPTNFTTQQIEQIRREGGVTDLIAPSLFHHLFFQNAAEQFPHAKRWGTHGFLKKRPDIQWTEILNSQNWPYTSTIEIVEVRGVPAVNELVFLHTPSRTLVVTDLCFNLLAPRGWAAPLILRAFGTYKRFNLSRLYISAIKDRAAFAESMQQILALDFDRLVMAHGTIVESGGKQKLQQVLEAHRLI